MSYKEAILRLGVVVKLTHHAIDEVVHVSPYLCILPIYHYQILGFLFRYLFYLDLRRLFTEYDDDSCCYWFF